MGINLLPKLANVESPSKKYLEDTDVAPLVYAFHEALWALHRASRRLEAIGATVTILGTTADATQIRALETGFRLAIGDHSSHTSQLGGDSKDSWS